MKIDGHILIMLILVFTAGLVFGVFLSTFGGDDVASVVEVETVPAVSSEGRWIVTRSPSGLCYEAFRWSDGPNRFGVVVGGPVECPP